MMNRLSYRRRRSTGQIEGPEFAAAVMFLSWIGAYVTGLNPGGAVHVLLLISGMFLMTHFRRQKAALFAMEPGEILSLQIGPAATPADYRRSVVREQARRALPPRGPRSREAAAPSLHSRRYAR